jgi:hypothetical protein
MPMFDVGVMCTAGEAAGPSLLVSNGLLASQAAQSLSAVNAPIHTVSHTVSLDSDPAIYNNTAAPHNCVGVCTQPPFSGSPWVVPAPSHWYASSDGVVGMAPSKALVFAPPVVSEQLSFGPLPKPVQAAEPEEPIIGPMPQPTAICLGMCSVRASPGRDKQGNVLAALASVWAKDDYKEKSCEVNHAVRPTPGHAIMCANALVLSTATSLWALGSKTFNGEANSAQDLVADFKENASANAEAVTPIGGILCNYYTF